MAPSNTITVEVTDAQRATLVSVAGEVDLATADRLTAAGRDLPAGPTPVVLDLERVSFMDSSGMRCLLDFSRTVEEAGRPLALLRPSAAVTRLLDLVDLRVRFKEIDDMDDVSLAGLATGAGRSPRPDPPSGQARA